MEASHTRLRIQALARVAVQGSWTVWMVHPNLRIFLKTNWLVMRSNVYGCKTVQGPSGNWSSVKLGLDSVLVWDEVATQIGRDELSTSLAVRSPRTA